MRREQKIPQGSCPARNRLEVERYPEAQSMLIQDTRTRNGGDLLARIVSRDNMVQAYKQVRKNGGAAGDDGMTLDGMKIYLSEHYETLIRSIIDRFKMKIRELLKRNQGRSIKTVLDRLNLYTRGWLNYYSIADAKSFIQRMNGLIGRKIRAYI